MKRFIVAVLALTLMFTEVLSPVQVNAVEKATQCEEKVFTVEPFIVGDEKLEGEGHLGEERLTSSLRIWRQPSKWIRKAVSSTSGKRKRLKWMVPSYSQTPLMRSS